MTEKSLVERAKTFLEDFSNPEYRFVRELCQAVVDADSLMRFLNKCYAESEEWVRKYSEVSEAKDE